MIAGKRRNATGIIGGDGCEPISKYQRRTGRRENGKAENQYRNCLRNQIEFPEEEAAREKRENKYIDSYFMQSSNLHEKLLQRSIDTCVCPSEYQFESN